MRGLCIAAFVLCLMLGGLPMLTVAEGAPSGGETLCNGIVLPKPWPPKPTTWPRERPTPPPYFASPPAVIPIDVGRQLFVDDFLIESTSFRRTHHLPTPAPESPVLRPEMAWETRKQNPMAMAFSDGVWWDPADGLFKMWYLAGPFTCLATSTDGVRWTRPALGVTDYHGGKSNIVNVPAIQRDSTTVWLDHEETDAAKRFKMSYFRSSLHILASADGITWRSVLAGDDDWGRGGLQTGDRSTIFYNPFRKVWVHSIRSGRKAAGGRCRYYSETKDLASRAFRNTRDCSIWTCADALDKPRPDYGIPTQLYNLDAAPYESLMIGLFSIWHGDSSDDPSTDAMRRDAKEGRPKINLVKIGFSRDGFHWSRPDRRPFFPVSEKKGDWNWGNVQSVGGGCLVVGDRLFFYHSGRAGKGMAGCVNPDGGGSTGLAFLRRDGFASMDAGAEGGTLTTRPVRFKGKHLFVNVDCPEGELRVELLDREGNVIAPFTRANCRPIAADSTLHRVTWEKAADLSAHAQKPLRFRFHLRKGKLYGFWVSPDASGASHGYVAAGGPGFTGPRDTVGRAGYRVPAGD